MGCAPRVDRKSCHIRAIFPIKLKSRPVHRYNSFKILYTMLYNLAPDWKRVISSSCIIEIIIIYETQILTFCIVFFMEFCGTDIFILYLAKYKELCYIMNTNFYRKKKLV